MDIDKESNVYDPSYKLKLKGKKSKFNETLYQKYDIPAREIIKKCLPNFAIDNPDPYKQDLVIIDENCRYKYIELQVCSSWVGEKFPYDNLYIFERKCHYDDDTLFITLNKYMTKGYIFNANSFKDQKPVRLKKYSREFIYNIPWNRAMPFIINKLTPACINLY